MSPRSDSNWEPALVLITAFICATVIVVALIVT